MRHPSEPPPKIVGKHHSPAKLKQLKKNQEKVMELRREHHSMKKVKKSAHKG